MLFTSELIIDILSERKNLTFFSEGKGALISYFDLAKEVFSVDSDIFFLSLHFFLEYYVWVFQNLPHTKAAPYDVRAAAPDNPAEIC